MNININVCGVFVVSIVLLHVSSAYSSQRLLTAKIDAGLVYNDNIFLTVEDQTDALGVIITPSLTGIIKEQHWQVALDARLRRTDYSVENLDSDEMLFSLSGRHAVERNIFSLNASHIRFSNLNSVSTDFGVSRQRVIRRTRRVTPQYTRLLTERSNLTLSYVYTNVDYLYAENTNYVPYVTQSGSAALQYNLTERDNFTISLTAVDYESNDKLITYQLFNTRLGVNNKVSETLTTNFSIGVSRRYSTNLSTQAYDFFGNPITITQEIDTKNRGLVYDAGIKKKLFSGQVGGRISRNNSANSYGGLDEVDQFLLNYSKELSSLWRYALSARIESVTSISVDSRTTDRDAFFINANVYYSLSQVWNVNASYNYVQRKFKGDTSEDRAPHSNRLFFGLTYNFPSLATF